MSSTLYLFINHEQWIVERRHEMAQLMVRGKERERRLYLFFTGPTGELRRAEIAEDFPLEPDAETLETAWRFADVLRHPPLGEMQSQAGMEFPTIRRTFLLLGRSILLRCPNCGGGHILKGWFALKSKCPQCGIRLERGEDSDYFLGGMMFNIAIAEVIFAIIFVAALIIMWPNVPWDGLEYVLVGAMIAAPIILYPMSRVMWLAFDLLFRPITPEEMQWHAQSKDDDHHTK